MKGEEQTSRIGKLFALVSPSRQDGTEQAGWEHRKLDERIGLAVAHDFTM